MELPDLPEGWEISFISHSAPNEWKVDAHNAEIGGWVYVTGSTLRYAMLAAVTRIVDDDYWTSADRTNAPTIDLVKALKIPTQPFRRRA